VVYGAISTHNFFSWFAFSSIQFEIWNCVFATSSGLAVFNTGFATVVVLDSWQEFYPW